MVPSTTPDSFQDIIDDYMATWIQQDCTPGLTNEHPYPTLATLIQDSTNQYYNQPVRICSPLVGYDLTSRHIICSYDDIDLAIVFKIRDGANFLDSLRPRSAPPSQSKMPPISQPTNPSLAFVVIFGNCTASDFEVERYKSRLQTAIPGTEVRVISITTHPVTPPSIALDTVILFNKTSDISSANQYASLLTTHSATIFGSECAPVTFDFMQTAAEGFEGCTLANGDCGPHGTLYPSESSGCFCKCDPGWVGSSTAPFCCKWIYRCLFKS